MPNLDGIQEAILTRLQNRFVQKVVEQSVPDVDTVMRNSLGQIEPYIAVQFGDIQQGVAKSMIGPRGDDYNLPVYIQAIAPTPAIARKLSNRVVDSLLGWGTEWTGSIRKRPGGGMFGITTSTGATECYQFPSSFAVPIQVSSDD